jgi:hypothetical protein
MRESSVADQRCEATRAVIADGETVTDVVARFGVARKTVQRVAVAVRDVPPGRTDRHPVTPDFEADPWVPEVECDR